jgi:GxxExxY protein
MDLILGNLSEKVIGASIEVHKELGPGFLESTYESALCIELRCRKIKYEKQKLIRTFYKNMLIGIHRIDLIVENQIILELKTVEAFDRTHFAQVKSYLKATRLHLGLLLNFNDAVLQIKRFVL